MPQSPNQSEFGMLHPNAILSNYLNFICICLLIDYDDAFKMDRFRSKLIDDLQSIRSLQSEEHLRGTGNSSFLQITLRKTSFEKF